MKVRYVTYIFLAILGASIVFGHQAFAQTRLGLHVTQEELNVWRQRMTDNVNTINGFTFQTVYQNRILADANSFRSQSHPGGNGFWAGYTGAGCAPAGISFNGYNGSIMMRSAFNFLLTGDVTYANPVRTELLNQITQAGTDPTNTAKWCRSSLTSLTNMNSIMPWLLRLTVAYDYLIAGGYTGFSEVEKTNIKQWLINWASRWAQEHKTSSDTVGSYPGTFATPQTLNCVNLCTTPDDPLYRNGPTVYQATSNWFNNIAQNTSSLAMAVGILTGTQSLIDFAVAWTTAMLKVGVFDEGLIEGFRRWSDVTPNNPGASWVKMMPHMSGMITVADIYARAGNTSLYDLTAPTQVLGGSGGTVGFHVAIETIGKLTTGVLVRFTGDGQIITWIDDNGHDFYAHLGIAAANLYYRNSFAKAAVEQNFKAGSGDTSQDCYDGSQNGCFSGGSNAAWADVPFMFGKMEGKVNPYGATPPPPGPAVTVDSTYGGYTTGPIDDGMIKANGDTATTWASANTAFDHWIVIDFGATRQISTATLYWAYNGYQQKYMTSNKVDVQYLNGSAYQTVAMMNYAGDVPSTTVNFPAVSTSRIRFYQGANQGNPSYPGVIWLTEVDYGTQTPTLASPPGDLRIISAQ